MYIKWEIRNSGEIVLQTAQHHKNVTLLLLLHKFSFQAPWKESEWDKMEVWNLYNFLCPLPKILFYANVSTEDELLQYYPFGLANIFLKD